MKRAKLAGWVLPIAFAGILVWGCNSCDTGGRSAHHREVAAPPEVIGGATPSSEATIPDLGFLKQGSGLPQAKTVVAGRRSGGTGFAQDEIDQPSVDPGLLAALAPGEELWVIEKSDGPAPGERPEVPGCGALVCRRGGEGAEAPVPLEHTDVKAAVSGYIASVGVTQKFHNPFAEKIEAVYVFPLPENAAVDDFVMTIGERRIRGIIREREEARRIYLEARRQGHVASLLTQERPNIFTQSVANIEPGKEIDVEIHYFHTLAYKDGAYELVFPMVVGPRFNPPAPPSEITSAGGGGNGAIAVPASSPGGAGGGIGAVPRGRPGTSGQKVEVAYLRPGERSGHDIAIAVEIDAGVEIESLECPSHAVAAARPAPSRATVTLSPLDAIPNRDFVLRYQVAGKRIKSGLLAHKGERGGFFTLMLFPPEDTAALERKPLELVFVLDCSGSMSGRPIEKAKEAVRKALRMLRPDDTFQVINFSLSASQLGPRPIPATAENVRRGLDYLDALQSEGGTMMITGIKAALEFPHDPARLRVVSFLTDGFIGNEAEIFQAIHERLGAARIFSFGVGNSTNRHLLEGMARIGRGAVAHVGLDDSAGQEVERFYERIGRPAMTGIEIDWGGIEVSGVFPKRLPDLFPGRPVIVTGRFAGGGKARVRVAGKAGEERRETVIEADLDGSAGAHPGIPAVWARAQIADLSYQEAILGGQAGNAELAGEIRRLALEHNLVSSYTAFVAVDSLSETAGSRGTSVLVPVPVPEGVRYETTVPEK